MHTYTKQTHTGLCERSVNESIRPSGSSESVWVASHYAGSIRRRVILSWCVKTWVLCCWLLNYAAQDWFKVCEVQLVFIRIGPAWSSSLSQLPTAGRSLRASPPAGCSSSKDVDPWARREDRRETKIRTVPQSNSMLSSPASLLSPQFGGKYSHSCAYIHPQQFQSVR